jgi:hypothetical protein
MQSKVHLEFISASIYSCCYMMRMFFCLMVAATAVALQKHSEVRLLFQGYRIQSLCICSCYMMKVFFFLMLAATAWALQMRSEVRLMCQGRDTEPGFMQLLHDEEVLLPDAGCHSWGTAEAV